MPDDIKTPSLKDKLAALEAEAKTWADADEERVTIEQIAVLEREKELRSLIALHSTGGAKALGEMGVDFLVIPSSLGSIVLKLGSAADYKKYRHAVDVAKDGDLPFEATHEFVLGCLVHPARQVFITMCDKVPGIPRTCAGPLIALHEGVAKARAGKS